MLTVTSHYAYVDNFFIVKLAKIWLLKAKCIKYMVCRKNHVNVKHGESETHQHLIDCSHEQADSSI